MGWLTDNWEIKLVAMALAVMVYLFTGTLIRVDRELTITLEDEDVVGLPGERYRVRSITPRELVIEVDGPQAVMDDFDAEDLEPEFVFSRSNLDSGVQIYDVTPALLRLPPEIRLRHVPTSQIRVTVDRVERHQMRVLVDTDAFRLPHDALTVTGWRLIDEYVAVEGPRRVIEELKAAGGLPVEPALVPISEDLVEPTTVTVPLQLDLASEELAVASEDQAESVMVEVTVAPAPGEVAVSLPLQVLAPPDFFDRYQVELHHEEIPITLRGPRNRLESLDVEHELSAFVDLSGEPELDVPQQRPVKIRGPSWLVVGQPQARVTVRLRRDGDVDPGVIPPPIEDPVSDDDGVVVPAPAPE